MVLNGFGKVIDTWGMLGFAYGGIFQVNEDIQISFTKQGLELYFGINFTKKLTRDIKENL